MPRIFIGCSSEAIEIAEAVRFKLEEVADCQMWDDNILELNQYTFKEIERNIRESDYCIFILSGDDKTISRNNELPSPRDNVILEIGLSVGILGSDKTFILKDSNCKIKVPSDLSGVILGRFNSNSKNIVSSVSPFCFQIREKIKNVSPNFRKITIAISGAQGVGKSTTVADLNRYLSSLSSEPNVVVKSEVARDLIKKGIGGDQNTRPEEYALYIQSHLKYYKSFINTYDIKLLDRSILDVLAYANANDNVHDNWIKMLVDLVEVMLNEIQYYFYIPIQNEIPLLNDKLRNIDIGYRTKIDNEIRKLLNIMYPKYIELNGDQDTRLQKILETLKPENYE